MGQDENLDHHHQKVDVDGNGCLFFPEEYADIYNGDALVKLSAVSNCQRCQIVLRSHKLTYFFCFCILIQKQKRN